MANSVFRLSAAQIFTSFTSPIEFLSFLRSRNSYDISVTKITDHTHTHIHTYTHTDIHTCTIHTQTHIHTYTHIKNIHAHTQTNTQRHTLRYTHTYTGTHIHTHVIYHNTKSIVTSFIKTEN